MWTAVATDRFGTPIGEIAQASARKARFPLNQSRTFTFRVRRDHPLINVFRTVDQCMVKLYDDSPGIPTLRFDGPVIDYQKQSQDGGGSLAVNCADVGWRVGKRLIEASKSKKGVSYPANAAAGGTMDRGAMAASIINGLNAAYYTGLPGSGDTGLRVGSVTPSSATGVGPWYYANALQSISALSATLDGFDFQILPTEPTRDATGLQLGVFNCGPVIGGPRPNTVFEYGDGKVNVASFTETGDAAGLLNRAYNLPPGFPDNATQDVLTQGDPTSVSSRGVIYEDVVQGDFTVDAMRQGLLQKHIATRKQPRTVITFQPTRDLTPGVVPIYGLDYAEGDIVRFRAVEEGVETVNALMRIYAVEMDIDEEGNATPRITLLSTG